ncbi:MAG TPA: hypothetical protein PKD16_19595 [Saprospiraceae bacterium]|jgi:hypothetical protein|nr:hypothetical protein [Saprospiraceae bacterium]
MNYKKYSDKDLLESYSTALDYSGKADKDLVAEIDNRGGIEQMKKSVAEQNIVPDEIKRIYKLVFSLHKKDPNPIIIKYAITSDILSPEQLDKAIDIAIEDVEKHTKDISINSRTIIGSAIGVIISSLIGAGLWCYSIIQTGKMYYIFTVGILIISYIIIRLLTKQSNNNVIVFIATFSSAFIAILLGLWFYKLVVG